VAQHLIDGGATVVTSARNRTEDTPQDSTFINADIRSADGARRLVDGALDALGGLDLLVNNATAAALPALRESERAAIVNVSSGVSTNPPAPVLHYGAAKAALESW
jgi:NAD(P)-dependent dehydrogenase (short-subunit alcohol dehydrogenase family)